MIASKYVASSVFRCRNACRRLYCRRFSTNATTPQSETFEPVDHKELILWQLKLSSYIAGAAVSIYGAYVVVSSGFQLERSRRKFSLHWNKLFYGDELPRKVQALLNSRFNACLSQESLSYLSAYFIKFDNVKENGVRRRDITLFLESVGVPTDNPFVERFIQDGAGESKEHRLVSGCSLQEFTDLLEALVLHDRLQGNSKLEERIVDKLKEFVRSEENDLWLRSTTFRLSNPFVSGAAKSLSSELSKYIKQDIDAAKLQDLQEDLERNYRLRDKLKQLSRSRRLSEAETRRLNNINSEIEMLEEEVGKQKHTSNLLWFM